MRVDQDSFSCVFGKSSVSIETVLGGEASVVVEDSSVYTDMSFTCSKLAGFLLSFMILK